MRSLLRGRGKVILIVVIFIFGFVRTAILSESKPSTKSAEPTPIIASDSEATFKESNTDQEDLPDEQVGVDESPDGYQDFRKDANIDVLSSTNNSERISAQVVKVQDGDTIEVDLGNGFVKTVRYIGIDTPETVDPRKSVQCFGREASSMNKSLVENQTVFLEKDVSETDKYGRLLRYVYLGDLLVNKYLVQEGFAHSSAYPPDISRQSDFDQAEEEARLNNKGLWGACGSVNYSTKSSATTSKDDKDCSDFSTHQEAQDYFISKGGSSTNNVDKLDGSDHDGQVCETLK